MSCRTCIKKDICTRPIRVMASEDELDHIYCIGYKMTEEERLRLRKKIFDAIEKMPPSTEIVGTDLDILEALRLNIISKEEANINLELMRKRDEKKNISEKSD